MNLADLTVGTTLDLITLNFSLEKIANYLAATSDDSDMWIQEAIVPPLLVSAAILSELMKQVNLPPNLMHTGQEHTAHSIVPVNTDLMATVTLAQYSQRGGALIASFEANLVDTNQKLLFSTKSSTLIPLDLD